MRRPLSRTVRKTFQVYKNFPGSNAKLLVTCLLASESLESLSDELPIFISESKSGSERLSAAAKKEKLARIVEMFKPAKTTQKSFAWDCVVSDDSKKDEKK